MAIPIRLRKVQYHVVVHDQAANGGPGPELFELTGDVLNLVWQNVLNLPGNAAFTLMRNNRKLARLSWMRHHIKIWREDDLGTVCVFAGKIAQPDHGPRDSVIFCWDYLALFQRVVVEYYLNTAEKRYSNKKIGDVMANSDGGLPTINLLDLARNKTGSPVEFVGRGTIQTPLDESGANKMKTGKAFGIGGLQNTLKVFYDLAEMSMANTTRTVVFEVAPDDRTLATSPQKFNLFSNRARKRDDYALTFPGTLTDFGYTEAYGQVLNKFYSLIRDHKAHKKVSQYAVTTPVGAAVGRDTLRLLEGAGKISTLVGITNDLENIAGQKLAVDRMARQARRVPRTIVAYPHQGYMTPYVLPGGGDWQLGDTFLVSIKEGGVLAAGDQIYKYLRVHSQAAAWSAEGGESYQLFLRDVEA